MTEGMTLTVDGFGKLNNIIKDSLRFSVIDKSLKHGVAILAGWSVKYRLSGPRPKYLGRINSFLANSILVNVGLPKVSGKPLPVSVERARTQKQGNNYYMDYGSNMPYAAKHEYGQGNTPARPYLRPALENARNQSMVETVFAKNIQRALDFYARG